MTRLTWVTRAVILVIAAVMLVSYLADHYTIAKLCLGLLIVAPWVLLNIYSFKLYHGVRRFTSIAPLILYIALYVVGLFVSH